MLWTYLRHHDLVWYPSSTCRPPETNRLHETYRSTCRDDFRYISFVKQEQRTVAAATKQVPRSIRLADRRRKPTASFWSTPSVLIRQACWLKGCRKHGNLYENMTPTKYQSTPDQTTKKCFVNANGWQARIIHTTVQLWSKCPRTNGFIRRQFHIHHVGHLSHQHANQLIKN